MGIASVRLECHAEFVGELNEAPFRWKCKPEAGWHTFQAFATDASPSSNIGVSFTRTVAELLHRPWIVFKIFWTIAYFCCAGVAFWDLVRVWAQRLWDSLLGDLFHSVAVLLRVRRNRVKQTNVIICEQH